jgi:hypothetical protein
MSSESHPTLKAMAIAITPETSCVNFEMSSRSRVHCQHTVKGHPYGSIGKSWDDWPFLTCLECLARLS